VIVLGFDTETKGLDWFKEEEQAFLLSVGRRHRRVRLLGQR
jgi:hypothetical protein